MSDLFPCVVIQYEMRAGDSNGMTLFTVPTHYCQSKSDQGRWDKQHMHPNVAKKFQSKGPWGHLNICEKIMLTLSYTSRLWSNKNGLGQRPMKGFSDDDH